MVLDWTSGGVGFGAGIFFVVALLAAELVARVRRVVVVVGVGVRRLLVLTRSLSILSSSSETAEAAKVAGVSADVTDATIFSASRRMRNAFSCAP